MAPPLADRWGPFHRSDDCPNGSHHRATHWRCIDTFRPANAPINLDVLGNLSLMKNEAWFEKGASPLSRAVHGLMELKNPIPRPPRAAVSEEGLYMELLAAEHSGEEPDDGELEGSGDDYAG
ncbi:hypothetical protein DFH06DRAFT_1344184 [Mycena polygramma]|nr:hypothetical protein DFH06DRAFT_1344184 [Mycena polygramma]